MFGHYVCTSMGTVRAFHKAGPTIEKTLDHAVLGSIRGTNIFEFVEFGVRKVVVHIENECEN